MRLKQEAIGVRGDSGSVMASWADARRQSVQPLGSPQSLSHSGADYAQSD